VTLVTGLSTVVSICLQLASVPICLHYWGKETYGAWLAVFAAFTLMRALDGGYISYVGNKLNLQYHQDTQSLRQTLASAIWGIVTLGALQLLVVAVLSAAGRLSQITGLDDGEPDGKDAILALLVLVSTWVLTGAYLGVVHRLLIPTGLMYQAAWWALLFQAFQFFALMLAAFHQLSLFHTALLFGLTQAVIYLASALYIRRKLPAYAPWLRDNRPAIGYRDLIKSLPLTLSGVLQNAGSNGLVLVVSSLAGPMAVPLYATARTLSNLWSTLVNILTSPLLPDVVRFHAKAEGQKLATLQEAHWLVIGSLVNISILAAYPFLEPVYTLWTAKHLTLDKPLLGLLLAAVSISSLGYLMNTYLSGVNNLSYVVSTSATRAVLAVALSATLLPYVGLVGVGIAIAVSETVILLITTLIFFRRALAQLHTALPTAAYVYAGASALVTSTYVIVDGFSVIDSKGVYWLALASVAFLSLLGWKNLDPEIQVRIRTLFHIPHRARRT
jgi:O-antigen/teichoic acid export membrane protein